MVDSISVLYHDQSVIVALKPAGILSQAAEKEKHSMIEILKEQIGGNVFPVHRLDRETAGVMVFARSAKAAAALSVAIQKGDFQKEYLVLLTASPEKEEDILEDLLFFDRSKNKAFPVKRERKGVKKAVLSYRLAAKENGLFLLRVFPKTGRTHQIRVQFASRKTPLYGDRKYGGIGSCLALFCRKISFLHPETKEEISFSALPPEAPPWDAFLPHIKETIND